MSFEFKLPLLGENIDTADVAEILVSVGDRVDAEQIVLELETEKAVVELPCPQAGTVSQVHVDVGQTISVGSTILTIDSAAADGTKSETVEAPIESPTSGPSSSPAEESPQPVSHSGAAPARQNVAPSSSASAPTIPSPAPQVSATAADRGDGRMDVPVPAGPATRRFARELGVDLRQVSGSGDGGRITTDDVQAYVQGVMAAGSASPVSTAQPTLPDFSKWGAVESRRLNKIARSSADHLTMCWQTIPHVTQHDLADITELENGRRRYLESAGKSGPKITMTVLVAKAVVSALKQFPHCNSSLDLSNNQLIVKSYFHIGFAVDTPNGLLVPVIRDVDKKSVVELAAELTDLAQRARDRKLALAEMQGGTFTITNLGGVGGTSFTPIVNHPEVAILGLSRARQELQMDDGAVQQRLMLPLSLSYDHRVINGADAARFVVAVASELFNPFSLLIENT